jgi:hypothetical protein
MLKKIMDARSSGDYEKEAELMVEAASPPQWRDEDGKVEKVPWSALSEPDFWKELAFQGDRASVRMLLGVRAVRAEISTPRRLIQI